jgi:arsenite-transporting ATPase
VALQIGPRAVDELVADELTVLPGVEDLLALAEVRRLAETGLWDVVVVDCGPTAETLRLLGLPEALAGYLERLFPAHRRAVRGMLVRSRSASSVRSPVSCAASWSRASIVWSHPAAVAVPGLAPASPASIPRTARR